MATTREDVLKVYDALIASHEGVERKGAKMPYTSMNGNMFTFVDADGQLCLRFSDDDLAAFQEAFAAGPVLQYRSVMRGYAAVPKALFRDGPGLAAWFAKAVDNARRLKPKPTKKPKRS